MAHMIIRHRVADYAAWRREFDDHRSARDAAGLNDLHVWRNIDDPDDLVLLFEATDVDSAREFVASPDLRDKMQEAGVQGMPEIYFLEEG